MLHRVAAEMIKILVRYLVKYEHTLRGHITGEFVAKMHHNQWQSLICIVYKNIASTTDVIDLQQNAFLQFRLLQTKLQFAF